MNISRRGFLGTLATALSGAAYDPELLLWKPGAKTIIDMGGVVPFDGCHVLSIHAITLESLRLLPVPPFRFDMLYGVPAAGPLTLDHVREALHFDTTMNTPTPERNRPESYSDIIVGTDPAAAEPDRTVTVPIKLTTLFAVNGVLQDGDNR